MMRITAFAFVTAILVTSSGAALAQLAGRGSDFDSGLRGDRESYRSTGGASRIVHADPAERYRDGVTALTAGKYRDAQRAFRDVLSREGRDPSTNFLMGVSLANDARLKDASVYFERALRSQKDFIDARGWLGVIYVKTDNAEKANPQTAALNTLKASCAGTCADAAAIDSALKHIEAALANPAAAPFPPLPKIAAAWGEAPYQTTRR